MTKDRIETGSLGWTHPDWDNTYYAEDLPEDWRLDFYGHHFSFVLMQTSEWLEASRDDVEQWLDDVKDTFEFFLAIKPEEITPLAIEQLRIIKSILADRLQGLVVIQFDAAVSTAMINELSEITALHADTDNIAELPPGVSACWRKGRVTPGGTIGFISAQDARDMRVMRSHIEAFLLQGNAAQLYLVFEGTPPSAKAMQDAQIIIQMLA